MRISIFLILFSIFFNSALEAKKKQSVKQTTFTLTHKRDVREDNSQIAIITMLKNNNTGDYVKRDVHFDVRDLRFAYARGQKFANPSIIGSGHWGSKKDKEIMFRIFDTARLTYLKKNPNDNATSAELFEDDTEQHFERTDLPGEAA